MRALARVGVMGYDLYITRREIWSDLEGPAITYFDWMDYLNIDPSLQRDVQFESKRIKNGGSEDDSPGQVIWKEWSVRKDGKEAKLWLEDGNIKTGDADPEFRRKMFIIADVLGAKLQGERNELYDSMGNSEEGGITRFRRSRGGKRPWSKLW